MLHRLRPLAKSLLLTGAMTLRLGAKVPRVHTVRTDGTEVLSQGADELAAPASTLKAITAWVVRQHIGDEQLDDTVVVDEGDVHPAFVLRAGDVVTYRDLLAGMMLPSDNACAAALGRAVGERLGGSDARARFLDEMHTQAARLGWDGVRFADTSGDDNSSRLSARHLAELMLLLADDPTIVGIMGAGERTLHIGGPAAREVTVRHTLARDWRYFPQVIAGKTGGTAVAGSCMVWLWTAEGRTYASAFTGAANAVTRSVAIRQTMGRASRLTAG